MGVEFGKEEWSIPQFYHIVNAKKSGNQWESNPRPLKREAWAVPLCGNHCPEPHRMLRPNMGQIVHFPNAKLPNKLDNT